MKRTILLHYHEINLKGNNRGWFENQLIRHVRTLLNDLPHGDIRQIAGRLFIDVGPDAPVEEFERRLQRVFGIANLASAWKVPADMETIRTTFAHLLQKKSFKSFRIHARRGTKEFPLNSQKINEDLGRFVQSLTGADVRLEAPELTCFVEIVAGQALLYFEKIAGAGGLPTGTGGKVLCLLSGGIDSPVAAFQMMRRGCKARFVHFHSFPHTTLESQEKVRRILQILSRYQLESKVHFVPFAEVQREIVAYAPPALRVIIYRRFMLRIAEAIALQEGAPALVTGDSLGQVASQTLENLRTISAATNVPLFRPLIGSDKEEIMRVARQIGTYDISILPDQDCCSLFVPKHPETMAKLEQVNQAESLLDVGRLVAAALSGRGQEVPLPDFAPVPSVRSEDTQ
ncbi:MAG: thiI [Acidobacteria bacterium]|nr:thiI [Acidobacteriota bacterium]